MTRSKEIITYKNLVRKEDIIDTFHSFVAKNFKDKFTLFIPLTEKKIFEILNETPTANCNTDKSNLIYKSDIEFALEQKFQYYHRDWLTIDEVIDIINTTVLECGMFTD